MNLICKLFGLVPEAPKDGRPYVRCDRKWVAIADVSTDSETKQRIDDALKLNH